MRNSFFLIGFTRLLEGTLNWYFIAAGGRIFGVISISAELDEEFVILSFDVEIVLEEDEVHIEAPDDEWHAGIYVDDDEFSEEG